ncbi:MAG: cyclic nucleotide-binding domain-containing protein [Mariprofundaceae bacterium]|nr:cyclic nucleotide-binding domain-containing protein [Mariprofundaceae bacterium]
MNIDIEWLEERVLLCKLNDEDRALVAGLFEVASYAKGDVIVAEGTAGGELYLLRSGRADITCMSGGQSIRVAVAREASLFGEMSFLTGDVASATVTAKEDTVIYKLSRSAYSELMIKNQDLVYALFAHMLVHAGSIIRHMNEEQIALQNYITGRRA